MKTERNRRIAFVIGSSYRSFMRSTVSAIMGQKVNPIGFRIGIMEGWKSRWYASKQEFTELLIEDHKLRKFIKDKYKFAGIPKIEIERTRDEVKIILHAARPGIIIGRKGRKSNACRKSCRT